jgi:hypothetical protein
MSRWRGGTVIPAAEKESVQCGLSAQTGGGKSVGYCARVGRGPLIVTDLHVPSTCSADLFALGGSITAPKWIAYMPKNTPTHITGASLAVDEGGDLVIGITAPSEARIGRDLACSMTWAGWGSTARPVDTIPDDPF